MAFLISLISAVLFSISIPSVIGVVHEVIGRPLTSTVQIRHDPLGLTPLILQSVGM